MPTKMYKERGVYMNKKSKKVSSMALALSLVVPGAINTASALDTRENPGTQSSDMVYKDGTYTGYGRGYYGTEDEAQKIRMDVTVENGEIKTISYTPDSDGYEYPDDGKVGGANYKNQSGRIIDLIKNGRDPYRVERDLSAHVDAVERKKDDDSTVVPDLDSRYDVVSGATYSARGVAEAVVDALDKSRSASEDEKVINSINVLGGPEKSPFAGDNLDLTTFKVEISYSDSTSEQISYADFASNGLKLFLSIGSEEEQEVTGNSLRVEQGGKAYNFAVRKDGSNTFGSYKVVSKNKFLYEKNLFYKIGDGEYKEITPLRQYSKNRDENYTKPNSDQDITIKSTDIGKVLTLKTTQYYNVYDNVIENVEYEYTPVTITQDAVDEGYVEVDKKGKADTANKTLNGKRFDSGSFFINITVEDENDAVEDPDTTNPPEENSPVIDPSTSKPTEAADAEVPTDDSISINYFKYIPYNKGTGYEQLGEKVEAVDGKLKSEILVKQPYSRFDKYEVILSYLENGVVKETKKEFKVIPEGKIVFDLTGGKRVEVTLKYFRPLFKKLQYAVVDTYNETPEESKYRDIPLPNETYFDAKDLPMYKTEIRLTSNDVGKYIKFRYEFMYPEYTRLEGDTKESLEKPNLHRIRVGNNNFPLQTYSNHNYGDNDIYTYGIRFLADGEVDSSAPSVNHSDKEITGVTIVQGPDKSPYVGEKMDISSLKVKLYYDNSSLYTEEVPYSNFAEKGLRVYVQYPDSEELVEVTGDSVNIDQVNKQYTLFVKKGDNITSKPYRTASRYKYLYEKNLFYSIDGGEFVELPNFKLRDNVQKGETQPRPDTSQPLTIKSSDVGKTITFKTTRYYDAVTGNEFDVEYTYEPVEITSDMVEEGYFDIIKKGKAESSSTYEGKKFDYGNFSLELTVEKDNTSTTPVNPPSTQPSNPANPPSTPSVKPVYIERPLLTSETLSTSAKNEVLKKATRIAGNDRYETSVDVSRKTFDKADTVILVNGMQSSDVLSAIPLANLKNAPILLVKSDSVPDVVKAEIDRLGAKNIIVIGGDHSVSRNIDILKTGKYNVQYLAGDDRYETAMLVANEVVKLNGGKKEAVVVVNGKNPVDALSISSLESLRTAPVLFTDSSKLNKDAKKFLDNNSIANVTVFGGEDSISSGVEKAITKYSFVKRYSGNDRYETSANIAKDAKSSKEIVVASGRSYADALTVGSYARKNNAIVLVVRDSADDESVKKLINNSGVEKVTVVGGHDSIKL